MSKQSFDVGTPDHQVRGDVKPELDKDKVTQAVVDCRYSLDLAADKLGVPFMELDAFVDQHPSLRALLKIGQSKPPRDLELLDSEKLLPAETVGSTRPLLNEEALVAVLKSAGVQAQDIPEHVNRVKYYRQLERDHVDVVNANLLVNYINLTQACDALKRRVLANEYANSVDAAKDHTSLARFSKLLLDHQEHMSEAKLTDARVKKLLAEDQSKRQLPQQPVMRGKAGWKPKEKLIQINTTGNVFLNDAKP